MYVGHKAAPPKKRLVSVYGIILFWIPKSYRPWTKPVNNTISQNIYRIPGFEKKRNIMIEKSKLVQ